MKTSLSRDGGGATEAGGCDVSVVVPARNEADRLPDTVEALVGFLDGHPDAEVVLAVDLGSTDASVAVAERLRSRHPRIRIAPVRSKGKGYAVLAGVEAARGAWVLIADSDLAVDPAEFGALIAGARRGAVAVGSRSVPGAVRIGEPLVRFLIGRAFNLVVRALVLPGIRDSQCGFKAFPREPGLRLLRTLGALGWVFDVEFLARARREGIPVVEVAVVWRYRHGSTVRPLRDLPQVVRELWRVRRVVGRQPGPD